MTSGSAELEIRLIARDEASKVLKGVKQDVGGFGKALGDAGKIASGFLAANVVQTGLGALTGFLGDSTTAARESMAVNAQLDAVLKSTAGTAGVTADAVRDQAAALEKLSLFEDEAIIGGQNLLLTFTNVGKDVFPQATETMLDMSQALGQDTTASALQLGKALNDPIQGVTALRRVGVSFTESQLEQIRTMQESGNIAAAQALILAELNKEFGGSAKAASDAAGAQEVYKDRMNDLQEQIGAKMIPIQDKLNQVKLGLVKVLADKVIPTLEELYAKHWPTVQKAIEDTVAVVEEYWPKIEPIFEFASKHVITQVEGMIQTVQGIIQVVTGVVEFVDAIIHGDWDRAWNALNTIVEGALNIVEGTIKRIFGALPGLVIGLAEDLAREGYNAGKRLADSIIDGIGDLATRVGDKISVAGVSVNDVGGAIGGAADFVSSPFRAAGGPVMGGMGYIVGERGPELFVPRSSGTIVPNHELGKAGGVNVYVDKVYARTEAEARRAGNDIGWAVALRSRGYAA